MLDIIFSKSPLGRLPAEVVGGRGGSVKKVVSFAARHEKKIRGTVEVTIVGEKKIKSLNAKYRGKNKVTDVLSFSWLEGGEMPGNFLGQIFICYPQSVRQAKEYKILVEEEFARMLVHGLLHLVGYDHIKDKDAKKMFALQEKIIKKHL